MGKVALLFDYDGVLAPITPNPSNSSVNRELVLAIRKLREEFKVAVVSGRDCPFLYENIPGLDGYACVYGLEVHGGGYVVLDEEIYRGIKPKIVEELALKAKGILGKNGGVILGRTLSGTPLGMSIYWFTSAGRPADIWALVNEATSRGLVVYDVARWGNFAEYIDVHVAKRSKRESVRILKTLLEVDKVVYFGDSVNDIPAFMEANICIFVKHEFNRDMDIEADYVVEVEDLPRWVSENAHLLKE